VAANKSPSFAAETVVGDSQPVNVECSRHVANGDQYWKDSLTRSACIET
jgi:hypothetical protein